MGYSKICFIHKRTILGTLKFLFFLFFYVWVEGKWLFFVGNGHLAVLWGWGEARGDFPN